MQDTMEGRVIRRSICVCGPKWKVSRSLRDTYSNNQAHSLFDFTKSLYLIQERFAVF